VPPLTPSHTLGKVNKGVSHKGMAETKDPKEVKSTFEPTSRYVRIPLKALSDLSFFKCPCPFLAKSPCRSPACVFVFLDSEKRCVKSLFFKIFRGRAMKTYMGKKDEVERRWFVVDASNRVLGRLASQIAMKLRGKDRPFFTPHTDMGDFVVVINAEKVKVTGKKLDQKFYYRYSGYLGGLKVTPLRKMLETKPEEVIRHAVWGMLPKNRLGRQLIKKLKVYKGPEHPHMAQQPKAWEM